MYKMLSEKGPDSIFLTAHKPKKKQIKMDPDCLKTFRCTLCQC